jgi:hypothetical protein
MFSITQPPTNAATGAAIHHGATNPNPAITAVLSAKNGWMPSFAIAQRVAGKRSPPPCFRISAVVSQSARPSAARISAVTLRGQQGDYVGNAILIGHYLGSD